MDKKYSEDLSFISKEMEKISYKLLDDEMDIYKNRTELSKKIASLSGTVEAISTILKVRYCK